MYFADEAIVCTNPELSSCRDSDKMVGLIASTAKRAAVLGGEVEQQLLITRYDPERVADSDSLSKDDIAECPQGMGMLAQLGGEESFKKFASCVLAKPAPAEADFEACIQSSGLMNNLQNAPAPTAAPDSK